MCEKFIFTCMKIFISSRQTGFHTCGIYFHTNFGSTPHTYQHFHTLKFHTSHVDVFIFTRSNFTRHTLLFEFHTFRFHTSHVQISHVTHFRVSHVTRARAPIGYFSHVFACETRFSHMFLFIFTHCEIFHTCWSFHTLSFSHITRAFFTRHTCFFGTCESCKNARVTCENLVLGIADGLQNSLCRQKAADITGA